MLQRVLDSRANEFRPAAVPIPLFPFEHSIRAPRQEAFFLDEAKTPNPGCGSGKSFVLPVLFSELGHGTRNRAQPCIASSSSSYPICTYTPDRQNTVWGPVTSCKHERPLNVFPQL